MTRATRGFRCSELLSLEFDPTRTPALAGQPSGCRGEYPWIVSPDMFLARLCADLINSFSLRLRLSPAIHLHFLRVGVCDSFSPYLRFGWILNGIPSPKKSPSLLQTLAVPISHPLLLSGLGTLSRLQFPKGILSLTWHPHSEQGTGLLGRV